MVKKKKKEKIPSTPHLISTCCCRCCCVWPRSWPLRRPCRCCCCCSAAAAAPPTSSRVPPGLALLVAGPPPLRLPPSSSYSSSSTRPGSPASPGCWLALLGRGCEGMGIRPERQWKVCIQQTPAVLHVRTASSTSSSPTNIAIATPTALRHCWHKLVMGVKIWAASGCCKGPFFSTIL